MLLPGFAAVAVAAAGALIITRPERAGTVVLVALTALGIGYIMRWALDEWQHRNDPDDPDNYA